VTVRTLHLKQPRTEKRVVECVVAGAVGGWFRRRGWRAFTLPLPFVVVIFYWGAAAADPLTRVHEFVHVEQDEQSPFFLVFWVKYLVELARRGYRRNWYEREAYNVEADAAANGLPEWAQEGPE